jgi:RNA polymerase sigma factor (sigma-70 family)
MLSDMSHKSKPSSSCAPADFWYAPDPFIRTNKAASKAKQVAAQIMDGTNSTGQYDEHVLFQALHTCAYHTTRSIGKKSITKRQRRKWAARWKIIRDYIVETNISLAYSMIRRYAPKYVDEDTLISEAMLALLRSVDRFNPWMGYKFSTYACISIRRAITRSGRRESRYREIFPFEFDISYEQPVKEPKQNLELCIERLDYTLSRNIPELTNLENLVIKNYFGLRGERPQCLREIAEKIGYSKEYIRQAKLSALHKLRDVLNEDPMLQ